MRILIKNVILNEKEKDIFIEGNKIKKNWKKFEFKSG
jgi:hypothetical protein